MNADNFESYLDDKSKILIDQIDEIKEVDESRSSPNTSRTKNVVS